MHSLYGGVGATIFFSFLLSLFGVVKFGSGVISWENVICFPLLLAFHLNHLDLSLSLPPFIFVSPMYHIISAGVLLLLLFSIDIYFLVGWFVGRNRGR